MQNIVMSVTCTDQYHNWTMAAIMFLARGLEIPNGTPCDCGKTLWNVVTICEHCGNEEFQPLPNPLSSEQNPERSVATEADSSTGDG